MTITQAATNAAKNNKDWLAWFQSRDSAIVINQKQQETLFKTFDASIDDDEFVSQLHQHNETVFLHKVNFGNSRITMFHHLTVSGGTLYDSGTKEYGLIQGLGEGHTVVMTPDMSVLRKIEANTDTAVPTITHLLNVKTKEESDTLTASATVKYRARNVIPVPPFLLKTVFDVINEHNGDARVVLVKSAEGVKEFDTTHANDADYHDKAKTKCKDFLYWLYLVGTNSAAIAPVNTIVSGNAKLREHLKVITEQTLSSKEELPDLSLATQLEASLKRPFEVLAATSASTTDFMEKLTQLQNQSNKKASKTFKKIPAKYQQMILVAASSSEVTEVDYDANAAEFFKCSTPLHAQVMLNSILEAEGIECSVSAAMATTLLYGSFLWQNPLSPAGLAASVLTTEGIIRSDTLQEGMVLDFATKFEMSAISLSKLTKTQVLFPKDVEEMTHRIRGLHLLATFFFKKHGFMSQGLKQVANFCLDNRSLLKTKIYLDKEFIAKFLCAVDEQIYSWLKQCSVTQAVTDTDLNLMNYSSLIQDVKLNRFMYILPPTTASIESKTEERKMVSKNAGTRREGTTAVQRNPDRVEEWKLRNGESWSNVFRNKAIEGPMLNTRCHPCLKYHVRGSCYVDCKNKASHCVLKGEDTKKVSEFIRTLRGE